MVSVHVKKEYKAILTGYVSRTRDQSLFINTSQCCYRYLSLFAWQLERRVTIKWTVMRFSTLFIEQWTAKVSFRLKAVALSIRTSRWSAECLNVVKFRGKSVEFSRVHVTRYKRIDYCHTNVPRKVYRGSARTINHDGIKTTDWLTLLQGSRGRERLTSPRILTGHLLEWAALGPMEGVMAAFFVTADASGLPHSPRPIHWMASVVFRVI